jgi:hypothetical protein
VVVLNAEQHAMAYLLIFLLLRAKGSQQESKKSKRYEIAFSSAFHSSLNFVHRDETLGPSHAGENDQVLDTFNPFLVEGEEQLERAKVKKKTERKAEAEVSNEPV